MKQHQLHRSTLDISQAPQSQQSKEHLLFKQHVINNQGVLGVKVFKIHYIYQKVHDKSETAMSCHVFHSADISCPIKLFQILSTPQQLGFNKVQTETNEPEDFDLCEASSALSLKTRVWVGGARGTFERTVWFDVCCYCPRDRSLRERWGWDLKWLERVERLTVCVCV